MSHPAPAGRTAPRWSVAGHPWTGAASIARLPSAGRRVMVGPPLSASGPSSGSAFAPTHDGSERLMLVSLVIPVWQAGVVFPAKMLSLTDAVSASRSIAPSDSRTELAPFVALPGVPPLPAALPVAPPVPVPPALEAP